MNSSTASSLLPDGSRRSVEHYLALFPQATADFEAQHPHWRGDALAAILLRGFENLRHRLESASAGRLDWSDAFHAWRYPVGWEWSARGAGRGLTDRRGTGGFTAENTATPEIAAATMHGLIARHGCIKVLAELTRWSVLELQGGVTKAFLREEDWQLLEATTDGGQRQAVLEALVRPFAIGAAEVDFSDMALTEGPFDRLRASRVPAGVAGQLADLESRTDCPPVIIRAVCNGREIELHLIVQIEPLMVDHDRREAYHALTAGLFIVPEMINGEPVTPNPAEGTGAERAALWEEVFREVDGLPERIAQASGGTPEATDTETQPAFQPD